MCNCPLPAPAKHPALISYLFNMLMLFSTKLPCNILQDHDANTDKYRAHIKMLLVKLIFIAV